ncbi:MAG: lipopolysaccharide biosynthesis protein [Bacteroidaceae bacterium]|nr:lipopolysaccharide biosynthesis protein [Bacteroidaceae bacterium]
MSETNNKRIAKNTLILYMRMFFMMAISLYTSRVILKALGVEDFGIYNVVGGVVSMMGVINNAMSVSTQRYLTFELGRGDLVRLKQTFSMCVNIYMLLSVIFFVLAETIGLWFLNTRLVIPPDRLVAANWVYQFTIFSTIISLLSNPYNAVIISHEKMGVYAYISILDAVLKLAVVFAVFIVPFDKLIVYGFCILLIHLIDRIIYGVYCQRKYAETRYNFYWEKPLFKQLLSYTGWNLFGALSGVAKGQGLNILLNVFFNPSINAARGIAYQVNAQVSHFFTNFYTAVRPQITKYYAQGDLDNMLKLVFRSSKMSFYLILLISLPLIIEAPYVIQLWLEQQPEYVIPFMRLILVITAVDAMATPLMTTAHATGKIALYQFLVGTITMLNIPISYIFLKNGAGPLIVFEVSLIIATLNLFVRIWIVKRLINFPVWGYIKEVLLICVLVTIISSFLPLLVYHYTEDVFMHFLLVCLLSVASTIITVYYVGMNAKERTVILNAIKSKLHR